MLFIEVVLPVFILAFAGFALERWSDVEMRTLTNASLFLFTPSLVFASLMRRDVAYDLFLQLSTYMVCYTVGLTLLAFLIARMCNFDNSTGRALALTTAMMNCGNFGLPLVYFAYGDAALDASILTFVLFNIPLGTLAIVIAQGSGVSLKKALLNMLKIPIFHAGIAALACKGLSLTTPEFLLRPIELLGEAAIPVMLVLLGMQLSRSSIRDSWGFFTLASSLRLIIGPLFGVTLVWLIGLEGTPGKVAVLQTSTPSAVLPLLYSLKYKTRPDLVSGTILVSTLASAFTLTIILYWLG